MVTLPDNRRSTRIACIIQAEGCPTTPDMRLG
jgi:hypothetical protein